MMLKLRFWSKKNIYAIAKHTSKAACFCKKMSLTILGIWSVFSVSRLFQTDYSASASVAKVTNTEVHSQKLRMGIRQTAS